MSSTVVLRPHPGGALRGGVWQLRVVERWWSCCADAWLGCLGFVRIQLSLRRFESESCLGEGLQTLVSPL